jgi:hypothetical protein
VPTIGIHSGVVDAIEWGPIGKRAVALRRNMTCSPCYLARMEDCPRNYACMRGLEPSVVQEVSEVFLARQVARRIPEPLVEPEPPVLAAPLVGVREKGKRSRTGTKARRAVAELAAIAGAEPVTGVMPEGEPAAVGTVRDVAAPAARDVAISAVREPTAPEAKSKRNRRRQAASVPVE